MLKIKLQQGVPAVTLTCLVVGVGGASLGLATVRSHGFCDALELICDDGNEVRSLVTQSHVVR